MKNTREHILRTSLPLFLQKNYREVTMKEIVEKTGLSKGAFYHYFTSKEELFREITMMFFQLGGIDYSSFPSESLREFYGEYLRRIDQSMLKIYELMGNSEKEEKSSLNFFLILFEAIGRFPEFLEMEKENYEKEVRAWESMIARAKETGEIRSDSGTRELADLFLYCTDGVFLRFVNGSRSGKYSIDLQSAFDTIYNSLYTHEQA